MSTDTPDYALGEPHGNVAPYARYETKGGHDSGAGYMRWRSEERIPTTNGTRRKSVAVYEHRLLATILPEFEDKPLSQVFEELDGSDVHHVSGVKWLNCINSEWMEAAFGHEHGIEVLDHAEHAAMSAPSRTELRAYAEDTKREQERPDADDRCADCGEDADTLATFDGTDARYCLGCAKQSADGRKIKL